MHSEFFKAALNKNWKEGEECIVALPEDNPEHFKIFSGFLYTGQVHSSKEGDFKSAESSGGITMDAEWSRICDLWVLGEKLLSSSFKDACTDAFLAKIYEKGNYPNWSRVSRYLPWVFLHIFLPTAFRRLLIKYRQHVPSVITKSDVTSIFIAEGRMEQVPRLMGLHILAVGGSCGERMYCVY